MTDESCGFNPDAMTALPRRNRITAGELLEALRSLELRPQQRRIIADAFSRYGAEGITRPEFEAGLYRLLNERTYRHAFDRRDVEAVRRAAFPSARPFGRPPTNGLATRGESRTPGREAPPSRPQLRGIRR